MVTLVVPEGAMAIATYERKTAILLREGVNAVRKNKVKEENGEERDHQNGMMWDLTMAYYGVMGGFVVFQAAYDAAMKEEDVADAAVDPTSASETKEEVTLESEQNKDDKKAETSTQSVKPAKKRLRSKPAANKPLTLTPYGILLLAHWDKIPSITTDDVRDKSNANSLAKAIVFWQTLWMIVQVIGRAASKLPVTLLELHICLHAFCAVVMYGTWWDKPVDIDLPTEVKGLTTDQIRQLIHGRSSHMEDDPTNPLNNPPEDLVAFLERLTFESSVAETDPSRISISPFLTSRSGLGKLMYRNLCGHSNAQSVAPATSFFTMYFHLLSTAYSRLWKGRKNVNREGLAISFVGLVYGGVHLAAWNNEFPTFAEQLLWKIAAAITAAAWSVFVISLWLSVLLDADIVVRTDAESKRRQRLVKRVFSSACGAFFGVAVIPVLLVRLYLLVESFASLRLLPKGSYELLQWSEAWPHAS